MLRDILEKLNIEYSGAVDTMLCRPGNSRLYKEIPSGSFAVFMLFPYYVSDTAKTLAKFAAVPDYHIFASTVFAECEKYLSEKYPGRYIKGFADHSPLAECDGACRAGLGIMGRHSLLINEKYSSFVCIGEIICTLNRGEIEAEGITFGDGEVHFCEGCGKCTEICPAGCCGKAERDGCISGVTQKKQPLSEDESIMVQRTGYTWGCDRCSLVCPHSENPSETPIEFFRGGAIRGDAYKTIFAMDGGTFEKYPFSWRKKEIILRNFEIVRK